ncbi:MAG TPA: hypothetical protein VH589_03070 [Trebonia sp.]|jgi:hypothetical protein
MSTVRSRLQSALRAAMKERDAAAMSALRSALAAIDNAAAVPASGQRPAPAPSTAAPSENVPIAGGVAGLGGAEVARRAVTEEEAAAIAATEAADRRAAARDYRAAGRADRADRLLSEARAIESALEEAASRGDA